MFVNTATIVAADNEAQLAGVMAHEMSHVVLRHGTHQATKAQALQLPAAIAGAVLGGGMMGQLGRLGIGLGANSLLLHYSRDAEAQADYNGTEIMADAGFNPIEMARFFEKLESAGQRGRPAQFLSTTPHPGTASKLLNKKFSICRNETTVTTSPANLHRYATTCASFRLRLKARREALGRRRNPAPFSHRQTSGVIKDGTGRSHTLRIGKCSATSKGKV